MTDQVEQAEQPKMDEESARIVFDTASKEYADENDRGKHLEGKTGSLVAATGAIMLFVAGTLSKPPASLPAFWKGVYFTGVCITLFVLACGQLYFLRVFWIRDYQRLKLSDVVTMSRCCQEPAKLRWGIASAYRDIVSRNTEANDVKVRCYEIGLKLLCAGVAFLVVVLTVAGASSGI